jgi:hypothetical protein
LGRVAIQTLLGKLRLPEPVGSKIPINTDGLLAAGKIQGPGMLGTRTLRDVLYEYVILEYNVVLIVSLSKRLYAELSLYPESGFFQALILNCSCESG